MAATAKNVRQAVLYVLIRPWAFTALHVVRDIQWAPIPMDWEHAIKQAVRPTIPVITMHNMLRQEKVICAF